MNLNQSIENVFDLIREPLKEYIQQEIDKGIRETMEKLIPVMCRHFPDQFVEKSLWKDVKNVNKLFEEMKPTRVEQQCCIGKTTRNTPCKNKRKYGKYCHHHKKQYVPPSNEIPINAVKHNHDLTKQRFSSACPVCIAKKKDNDVMGGFGMI